MSKILEKILTRSTEKEQNQVSEPTHLNDIILLFKEEYRKAIDNGNTDEVHEINQKVLRQFVTNLLEINSNLQAVLDLKEVTIKEFTEELKKVTFENHGEHDELDVYIKATTKASNELTVDQYKIREEYSNLRHAFVCECISNLGGYPIYIAEDILHLLLIEKVNLCAEKLFKYLPENLKQEYISLPEMKLIAGLLEQCYDDVMNIIFIQHKTLTSDTLLGTPEESLSYTTKFLEEKNKLTIDDQLLEVIQKLFN